MLRLLGSAADGVLCVLPFPIARVVSLSSGRTVVQHRFLPALSATASHADRHHSKASIPTLGQHPPSASIPPSARTRGADESTGRSARRRVMLISHFYNEALLLPYWIRHHAHMFDHAVLIDYNSTDDSVAIIQREAPSSWHVVKSKHATFGAGSCDQEVMEWEAKFPDDWHLALTTTEFLNVHDARAMFAALEPHGQLSRLLHFPTFLMVGSDAKPLERFDPLVFQRSVYVPLDLHNKYSRFAHAGFKDNRYYGLGRHKFCVQRLPYVAVWVRDAFISKFLYTPYPQIIERTVQIAGRMSREDVQRHIGNNHLLQQTVRSVQQTRTHFINSHKWSDLHILGASQSEPMASLHRAFHEIYSTVPPGYDQPKLASLWQPERFNSSSSMVFKNEAFERGGVNNTYVSQLWSAISTAAVAFKFPGAESLTNSSEHVAGLQVFSRTCEGNSYDFLKYLYGRT